MTFTIQKLVDDNVLVSGTDINGVSGKTVLDGSEWALLQQNDELELATQDFNATVEAFFAPITEAAEKLNKTLEMPKDEINYLVLDEGTEGVEGTERHVVQLSHDSVIIRLIESGQGDRLIWVNDTLQVLAAPVKKSRARKA